VDESITRVTSPTPLEIEKFISTAGSSLNTFRYFKNRDVSCLDKHVVTFLYKQGHDYLGYGHLDKEGDDVWLGVCVAERHLGRGYGKQIMIDLLDAGSEQGIKSIRLTVDVNNSIAVKLYQKIGFFIESTVNNTFYMRLLLK
jgi:ribosomal protein S18 acetylase RimI-like enzyme